MSEKIALSCLERKTLIEYATETALAKKETKLEKIVFDDTVTLLIAFFKLLNISPEKLNKILTPELLTRVKRQYKKPESLKERQNGQ